MALEQDVVASGRVWVEAPRAVGARLEQLQQVGAIDTSERLKQAETNLTRARLDEERADRLPASGAIAPIELDTYRVKPRALWFLRPAAGIGWRRGLRGSWGRQNADRGQRH